MQKREFLRRSAFLAAGGLFLPRLVRPTARRPHPAGTRVSDIGIQLYTVRKEMLADPTGT